MILYLIKNYRELRKQYELYREAVLLAAKILYRKRNKKDIKEMLVRRFLEQHYISFWQWLRKVNYGRKD